MDRDRMRSFQYRCSVSNSFRALSHVSVEKVNMSKEHLLYGFGHASGETRPLHFVTLAVTLQRQDLRTRNMIVSTLSDT